MSHVKTTVLAKFIDVAAIDQNEDVLVDFDTKQIQPIPEIRKDILGEIFQTEEKVELVEIVDEFGRTRYIDKKEVSKYNILNSKDENEGNLNNLVDQYFYDSKKEIRDKGVGYYRLSTNMEERKKQLEQLNDLREKTKQARANHVTPAEKRKQAIEERRKKLMKINQSQAQDISDTKTDALDESITDFLNKMREQTYNKS